MTEDIPEAPVALTNDEIADRACDWSDYRKAYGERHPGDVYVFKAGWDAGYYLARRRAEQASQPEVVETIEQLAALPEETIVRDALGQYLSILEWPGSGSIMTLEMGSEMPGDARYHRFPMRVIERPEETS